MELVPIDSRLAPVQAATWVPCLLETIEKLLDMLLSLVTLETTLKTPFSVSGSKGSNRDPSETPWPVESNRTTQVPGRQQGAAVYPCSKKNFYIRLGCRALI